MHFDVHQNDVERFALPGIDRFLPIIDAGDAVPLQLEQTRGDFLVYGAIVRDQDAADEAFQDFAYRLLHGDMRGADPDRGKLKVSVSIFGRFTPVELEYWQVQRASE